MSSGMNPREEMQKIIKQAFPGDKTINSYLHEITDFAMASNAVWQADEKSRKLSIAFLNEADRDIASCRVLYSKKIYSHSIYHLQQAVEKAMKGYCLALGILSIQEIRGHDTPYVLLKGVLEKTGLKALLQSLSEDAKGRLDKAWEAIEKPEKRLEIARINLQQIKKHLSEIDNYKPTMKQMANKLNKLLISIKGSTEPLPLFIQTISILTCLYILGTISFPHEQFTRYPDGQMTPLEYTDELGIVKAIPQLNRYLVPAVKKLRIMIQREQ